MNQANLRTAFNTLPDIVPKTRWDEHRLSLRREVAKLNATKMLTWPTVVATMFVGNAPYIDYEMEALQGCSQTKRWRRAIIEPKFGKPPLYGGWTSGNLIHQAYHLKQWLDKTGKDLRDMRNIVEIGGGYGAMALVVRRMGFEGRYWILDLPEFSLLQKFYLSNVGIEDVEFNQVIKGNFDLLIGICSLSEMSVKVRSGILDSASADEYLMVYQPRWNEIDNLAYFGQFMMNKPNQWYSYRNPAFKNHWYMIGV